MRKGTAVATALHRLQARVVSSSQPAVRNATGTSFQLCVRLPGARNAATCSPLHSVVWPPGRIASLRSMKPLIFSTVVFFAALQVHAASLSKSTPSDTEREHQWLLMTQTSQRAFENHKLADAENFAKQALDAARQFDPQNDRVAISYCQLGNIYRDWDRCRDARANFSRAIAIWEKRPYVRAKSLFDSRMSLLGSLCECDDYDSAAKLLRKNKLKPPSYQMTPVDQARLLSLRASIAEAHKKLQQCEDYHRQAVTALESLPDPPEPLLLQERVSLSAVVNRRGGHADSLGDLQKLVAYFDRGPVPSVGLVWALNNNAIVLSQLGRREEARGMFERALDLAAQLYGPGGRRTATIMLNYAQLLHENHETPAAEAMRRKGLEAFQRSLASESAGVDVSDLRR